MKYFKKLAGERVYLSPINPDDYKIYTKWLNDPEVTQFYPGPTPVFGLTSAMSFFEERAERGHNFAIVRTADDALIGYADLHDIANISRSAFLGVFIGEAENRGVGYGAEALRLLLDYGFDALNLHSVSLSVVADNEQGIACYRKVGFKQYGRRREAMYKNGKYCDTICMDILEDEFRRLK